MANLIGSGYELIGTRTGKTGQTEFYNTQSGIGFENPQLLANFVQTQYGNNSVNADNVFSTLQQGYQPLNTPAPNPTQVLNQAQQSAFDSIKSSPVGDPNLLKEKANEVIGSNVQQIQTQVQGQLAKQDELLNQIMGYMGQTENEKGLNTELNNLETSYEMGQNEATDRIQPMDEITGELASKERRYLQQKNALVRQLQSETSTRQQKLEAAKFLYDSSRNRLSDVIELTKSTAPDNIGSYTDPRNGDMFVTMRNPVTGEITKQNVGNVGTPEIWAENRDIALKAGVSKPFYKVGFEIRNTATGEVYPTWEAYLAAGGASDLSNVDQDFQNRPVKFETKQIAGKYIHIGYNAAGEVVSQEDLGDANAPGNGKSGGSSGGSSGSSGSKVSSNGFTAFPATASANNLRNWLLANWHRKAGQPYYDVWGQAADIMRNNGVDPSKFDDVFWAVFRPGEVNPNKTKRAL
jgi:hypothetical protein